MFFGKKFDKRAIEEEEIIDDFNLEGEEVIGAYKTIERVNTILGGNSVFVNGVFKIIDNLSWPNNQQPIQIYDLGSGSGDGLRALARQSRKKKIKVKLIGVDANKFIVNYAEKAAAPWEEVSFQHKNIFEPTFNLKEADIVTFNLCLHHFSTEECQQLIQKCKNDGVEAILVNDLHRSKLAYWLFNLFCLITFANKIARFDGLLSIRKGFKRKELEALIPGNSNIVYQLNWKWAFRYQMIINFK